MRTRDDPTARLLRKLARFNRTVANPVVRLVAGWLPPLAIIRHRGRISERTHASYAAENDGWSCRDPCVLEHLSDLCRVVHCRRCSLSWSANPTRGRRAPVLHPLWPVIGEAIVVNMDVHASLHAYLSYRDAPGALAWMSQIGFEILAREDDEHGGIAHAEVKYGNAVLMIASADANYDTPQLNGQSVGGGLYLCLPAASDVDGWHSRAVEAGARTVFPPEETEWGARRARVLDPEGHEWSVGTYRPGSSW